jgi:hypothetical protein
MSKRTQLVSTEQVIGNRQSLGRKESDVRAWIVGESTRLERERCIEVVRTALFEATCGGLADREAEHEAQRFLAFDIVARIMDPSWQ